MTTLRERLQARRERIKSGLPPPQPVTMTPAFFEDMQAGQLLPRTCVAPNCGKTFNPGSRAQKTCGAKSCVRWNNDTKRKHRTPIEPRICAVEGCGREYMARNPNQKTCGAATCQRSYRLARQREFNAVQYQKRKRAAA